MCLMNYTRSDLAYIVSTLCRFTSNPGSKHLNGLNYMRDHAVIEGYTDASWTTNFKASKGRSGYVFTLGVSAVSWNSSKQTVVTRSIMQAEFVALDICSEEAEWLRNFLEDILEWPTSVPPICIYCNNQIALGTA